MLGNQPWIRSSPLEVLITRAADPSQQEPNYAIHIEVAEYINSKKANNPREAAMMCARLANHRNPHIAILSLALLDTLVQSCGYPFHLQISTKEFLNELVRRFPERPPPFPGPVMSRILELIHIWKEGPATESRWREDLGNIRDMHRLLTFKGYRFRDMPRQQSAQTMAATMDLKSADELENEDREAQSAKLQELIRRGTPRDLQAAQELMVSLAGANPEAKPDYRSQALKDLNKLESKVILLNEMLDNANTSGGERFVPGDVYDQVSAILSSARPKLQKWISDAETDDPESLDTFLQINDQINTVLNRYDAFKKGDYVTASNPIPAEVTAAVNAMSLIDFDDSAPSSSTPAVGLSNELDDLFGGSSSPAPATSNGGSMGVVGGAPSRSATASPATLAQFGSIALPGTPRPQSYQSSPQPAQTQPPNYFGQSSAPQGLTNAFGGMGQPAAAGARSPGTMTPSPAAPPTNNAPPAKAKDPFADLAGLF